MFGAAVLIVFLTTETHAANDAEKEEFLRLINDYRIENNHSALSIDTLLENAATWMSNDMISGCAMHGFMCSHTDSTGRAFSQRFQDFKYPSGISISGGENIAWGSGGISNAQKVLDMWKNSPRHNANMLSDSYKAIGISRSCQGNYCAWVTDFGGKVIQSYLITPVPVSAPVSTPQYTVAPNLVNLFTSSASNIPPSRVLDLVKYSDGDLIREKGGVDIYIIKYAGDKKFKRLILSPSVFKNYGHLKWSNVKNVDREVLDSFQTSDLVRAVGDQKVYRLNPRGDTGEKSWIITSEVFFKHGFDWDSVYQINEFDRDSYSMGAALE